MSQVEQIRSAINNLDSEVAKDTLALLLAAKEGTSSIKTSIQNNNIDGNFNNFAQIINYLKSKYKFQELSLFTTEADLVYVNTGDRKVLITDTTVKPREIKKPPVDQSFLENTNSVSDIDFENAWEPITASKKEEKDKVEPIVESFIPTVPKEQEVQPNADDAFEPKRKNGRFSNLEL